MAEIKDLTCYIFPQEGTNIIDEPFFVKTADSMPSVLEWAQFCSFPISATLGIIIHCMVIYRMHHYNVQLNKYHIFVISQSVNDILFMIVDLSTIQVFREIDPFFMQLLMHVEYNQFLNIGLVCLWNALDMLRDYMIAACTMHWYFAWKQTKHFRIFYGLLVAVYLFFTIICMGIFIDIHLIEDSPNTLMAVVNYGMIASRLLIFVVSLVCTLYLLGRATATRSNNKLLETAKRRMLISLAAKAVLIGLVPVTTLLSQPLGLLAIKWVGKNMSSLIVVYQAKRGSIEVIRCLQIFSPFLSGLVTFWSLRGFLMRKVTWISQKNQK